MKYAFIYQRNTTVEDICFFDAKNREGVPHGNSELLIKVDQNVQENTYSRDRKGEGSWTLQTRDCTKLKQNQSYRASSQRQTRTLSVSPMRSHWRAASSLKWRSHLLKHTWIPSRTNLFLIFQISQAAMRKSSMKNGRPASCLLRSILRWRPVSATQFIPNSSQYFLAKQHSKKMMINGLLIPFIT